MSEAQQSTEPKVSGLEKLEAHASVLEAAAIEPQQAAQQDQQQAQDTAATIIGTEIAGALEMIREMAIEAMHEPELRPIWSNERLQGIGTAGAMVMARHGWDFAGIMSKWGPHIMLVGALAAPAFGTFKLIKIRQAQAEMARQGARPAEGQATP
jgi:hypothetical protein